MDVSRLATAIIMGLIGGFVTFLLLWAFGIATQPWSLVVGVLCAVAYYFSVRPRL